MSINLERKNNLPIGNDKDVYIPWEGKRFIYYSMPMERPNREWGMLNLLGNYRCVNVMGQVIPSTNIRAMVKGNELKLKIVYDGQVLKNFDIYLEETLEVREGFKNALRYSNGGIVEHNHVDHIVVNGYSTIVEHSANECKTFDDKEGKGRFLLSLGTDRSNAGRVDVVVFNLNKGIGRHVPRANVNDLIPSVITIPSRDINGVVNNIGEDWKDDELIIRVYVSDDEPLQFKSNDLRHDLYLSQFGTSKELLTNIEGIAGGLEKVMELGVDELSVTSIASLRNGNFTAKQPVICFEETFGMGTIPCRMLRVGDSVRKNNGVVNTWRTVKGQEAGAFEISGEVKRPNVPYSIFLTSGESHKDVTNDTTIVKTTTDKLSGTMDNVKLSLLIKGCSRFEEGYVPLKQSIVDIEGPLLKFVEVKLNKSWLRPGIDFIIHRKKLFFLLPILKGADTYTLITYGDEPWDGRFKNLNAIAPTHEFPEIKGAHPDDIVVVNERRFRYEDIVGRGVVANKAYSITPLRGNEIQVRSKQGDVLVFNEFRLRICEWVSRKTNKEIYNVELKDVLAKKSLMKIYESLQRIHAGNKYIHFTFTTNMAPPVTLGSPFNEAVMEKSEQLFKDI